MTRTRPQTSYKPTGFKRHLGQHGPWCDDCTVYRRNHPEAVPSTSGKRS